MTWQDAVEIEVARTKEERFRWLCSDDNPNIVQREAYRALLIEQAAGAPSFIVQAGTALGALGRVAGAVLTGEPVKVAADVYEARTAICAACSEYDAAADRCRACGCYGLKRWLATERCPLDPPKWQSVHHG